MKYVLIIFLFFLENLLSQNISDNNLSWDIDETDGFISVSREGNITKGDRLFFFLNKNDCSEVLQLISVYSLNPNNLDYSNLDGYKIKALINNNRSAELTITSADEFLLGFRALISLGVKKFGGELILELNEQDIYEVELLDTNNLVNSNPDNEFLINTSTIRSEVFFDQKKNTWNLDGIGPALISGQNKCFGYSPDVDLSFIDEYEDILSEAAKEEKEYEPINWGEGLNLSDSTQPEAQESSNQNFLKNIGYWFEDLYWEIHYFIKNTLEEITLWFKSFNPNQPIEPFLTSIRGELNNYHLNLYCDDENKDGNYFSSHQFGEDQRDAVWSWVRWSFDEFPSQNDIFDEATRNAFLEYEKANREGPFFNYECVNGPDDKTTCAYKSELDKKINAEDRRMIKARANGEKVGLVFPVNINDLRYSYGYGPESSRCLQLNILFEYANTSNYKDLVELIMNREYSLAFKEYDYDLGLGYDPDTKIAWTWRVVSDDNYPSRKFFFEQDLDKKVKQIIKNNEINLEPLIFPIAESSLFYQQYSNFHKAASNYRCNFSHQSSRQIIGIEPRYNPLETTFFPNGWYEAEFNENGYMDGCKEADWYVADKIKKENEYKQRSEIAQLERKIEELSGWLEVERENNRLDRELEMQPSAGSIFGEALINALSDYYSPNSITNRRQQKEINALKREIQKDKIQDSYLNNRNRNN